MMVGYIKGTYYYDTSGILGGFVLVNIKSIRPTPVGLQSMINIMQFIDWFVTIIF